MTVSERLKPWHRRNAVLLLIFLAAHVTIHVTAVLGPEQQSVLLDAARAVYRATVIEIVLIALFMTQVALGLILVWPRLHQSGKSAWSWAQIASGLYLAVFIVNHIFLGVLRGRTFEGVETGFHFVAATMMTAPFHYAFIPYYALAIIALFVHVAAALHWAGRSERTTRAVVACGVVVAALIVGSYSGLFYPIELPDAYRDYMDAAF